MVPVHRTHNIFLPWRLPFKEIFSECNGGVCLDYTGVIIVSHKLISDGYGGRRRWRWFWCWSCMPASVRDVAKDAGVFVAPFIELDLKWNRIAWLEVLVAVDMATMQSTYGWAVFRWWWCWIRYRTLGLHVDQDWIASPCMHIGGWRFYWSIFRWTRIQGSWCCECE